MLRTGGALYLVVLAWKLARARVGELDSLRPLSFLEGAMFQAVNPKSWIRAITLASVFMPAGANRRLVRRGCSSAVVGAVIGFPCISMWALFGVAMRGFLQDARKQRLFNLAMAGSLLVLAASFVR